MESGLCIMHGLPGSGKSTFAGHAVYFMERDGMSVAIVNRDTIRVHVTGGDIGHGVKEIEDKISTIHRSVIHHALKNGITVICDDTNLTPFVTASLVRIADKYNAPVYHFYVNTPVKTCIERAKKREAQGGRGVPVEVIERMARKSYGDYGIKPQRPFVRSDNTVKWRFVHDEPVGEDELAELFEPDSRSEEGYRSGIELMEALMTL